MKKPYFIKEAFYTLQGEGAHAGMPAVFVRFAGCNLWSGREEDRERGAGSCSRWCDTDFVGTDGGHGGKYAADEIVALVLSLWPDSEVAPRVVLTGGEPALQVDSTLVEALGIAGCWVAVETNGTREIPTGIDWVCVSPKAGAPVVLTSADEVKVVWPQDNLDPEVVAGNVRPKHLSIQPRDGAPGSLQAALAYVKEHPRWRLSLQLHKIVGIP